MLLQALSIAGQYWLVSALCHKIQEISANLMLISLLRFASVNLRKAMTLLVTAVLLASSVF
jgi:hypothetical protein